MKRVILLCLTKGRHQVTERVLRCFLEQDYEGEILLFIHNNSEIPQTLGNFVEDLPKNRKVILVNKSGYNSLGQIYNSAYDMLPDGYDVINHYECDDVYLPNHVSEGVKNLTKSAYKPYYSWFRTVEGVQKAHNLLEPSIFFKLEDVLRIKCSEVTGSQFHPIINTLIEEGTFEEKEDTESTLVYTWDGEFNTFKTSGNPENNFENYAKYSQDHGDGVLDPWTKEQIQKYYNECTQK